MGVWGGAEERPRGLSGQAWHMAGAGCPPRGRAGEMEKACHYRKELGLCLWAVTITEGFLRAWQWLNVGTHCSVTRGRVRSAGSSWGVAWVRL